MTESREKYRPEDWKIHLLESLKLHDAIVAPPFDTLEDAINSLKHPGDRIDLIVFDGRKAEVIRGEGEGYSINYL